MHDRCDINFSQSFAVGSLKSLFFNHEIVGSWLFFFPLGILKINIADA